MKIITQSMLAATVALRWKGRYYGHNGEWRTTPSGSTQIKYNKITALGKSPKPKDIEKIIGNSTWIKSYCSACGDIHPCVISMNDFDPDDPDGIAICPICIREAHKLI